MKTFEVWICDGQEMEVLTIKAASAEDVREMAEQGIEVPLLTRTNRPLLTSSPATLRTDALQAGTLNHPFTAYAHASGSV
jgi:hypothetical protein